MPDRRSLLAAASLLLAAGGRPAAAQARFNSLYMFIPAGPGGGWDGLGRAIEQVARQAGLVSTFQFENVGGAGGTVGLPRFVGQRRGRPDSLMVAGSIMVGATFTNRTPVGIKDLVPVARLTEEAGVVVVPAQSEIQDLKGLLEALKANPGGVAIAGGSAGGTDHITLGLILKALGRSAKEGSYVAFAGGGPAQAAILGAQVKAGISGLSEFAEQIKAGRMRALATTGAERTDPAIPTLKENGLDVVMTNWRGVFAAPGIRPDARQKLVDFITELHALPAWQEMLKTRDWADAFLTGDAFTAFLAEDQAKTEAVLKEVGLA
ncbi:tripartite tricarboxylate transporter substrate binding protein [Siccirubricoccus sp. KC 17139]|uniref:Tripartite tricarboxylate transporter substrate binding protein n=1 Tax=Siccirubricoccus soli TaxID=2899147 RepID=A0ABT1DBN5_9PROT|nr:tripartite tricarboxylate transporter substrate-binding protein [Siccirubricoccus soli]MCO6419346.1 tripartite tricarboxylate transporter substrate binding protein [Siccirubricoccus soli]MCP2685481.1 tripartite tricarboxylate transporter substrate-binding protein [Siccirubricoccus soli]